MSSKRKWKIVAFLIASVLAFAFFVAGPTTAQDATSGAGAHPFTPDPSECTVAPLSGVSLAALVSTPTSRQTATDALPSAVVISLGRSADAAIVADVTYTLREATACVNAGDVLRLLALFTPDALRRLEAEGVLSAHALLVLAGMPSAALPDQRVTLVAVTDIAVRPDGRVGAFAIQDDPTSLPEGLDVDYVVLARVGDRWLIDETIDTWWSPAAGPGATVTP